MPGDLGDVGSASLTHKNISNILDALFQTVGSPRQDGTFSENHKTRLELTVRLLACAQRLYLSKAEWESMEDPVAEITTEFENQPVFNDYNILHSDSNVLNYGVCSSSALAESPFVRRVLRHLYAVAPGSVVSLLSVSEDGGIQASSQCEVTPSTTRSTANSMLEALALSAGGLHVKESQVIALLHIVSAAAEVFPLGVCWTSSTGAPSNWRKVSEIKCGSASMLEQVNINTGSLEDLAVVIRVIRSILEAHGGYNASAEIQRWVLICLNKLAIATDAHLVVAGSDAWENAGIAEAWRQVWDTLLGSNLSFSNLTKSTKPGSSGDLVLRLLTQIVRFSCVDPANRQSGTSFLDSFLVKQQADLWNLPVFERVDIQSPSVFMLVFSILCGCGLNDRGGDSIGRSVSGNEEWLSRIQRCGVGLRSKLLCFCLYFLEQSAEQWKEEQLISIVIACTMALVNGCSCDTSSASVFFGTVDSDPPRAGLLPGDTVFTRIFENSGGLLARDEIMSDRSPSVFSSLWAPSLSCAESLVSVSDANSYGDSLDFVGNALMYIQHKTYKAQQERILPDSACRFQSERHLDVAAVSLRSLVSFCLEKNKDLGFDPQDNGFVSELKTLEQ